MIIIKEPRIELTPKQLEEYKKIYTSVAEQAGSVNNQMLTYGQQANPYIVKEIEELAKVTNNLSYSSSEVYVTSQTIGELPFSNAIQYFRNDLAEFQDHFQNLLNNVQSPADLEVSRLTLEAEKGPIKFVEKVILGGAPKAAKREIGRNLNELKVILEQEYQNIKSKLKPLIKLDAEIDLSMPARTVPVITPGHEHPLMKTLNEMISIFERMGFAVEYGPEIEDDEHNFGKLNFAPDHPARDMQDTFFVKPSFNYVAPASSPVPLAEGRGQAGTPALQPLLLRTHTSPVQIRLMEKQKPPVRAIMPGRVYRNEAASARSAVAFFQLEGLVIDKGVTMADLKGILLSFARQFFGSDAKIRLRPSFFPFTEPSAEVDVSCYICGGKGCRVCQNTGWLEILGSGMVHPNVLRACGIDPEIYTGYAFGLGIDRTAMMRYGVSDIRDFFENDYRFLEQF